MSSTSQTQSATASNLLSRESGPCHMVGLGMVGRDCDDEICFYAESPASNFGPELIRRVPQLVLRSVFRRV